MSDATSVSLGGETLKATAAKFTMAAIGFLGTIVFARVLGPTGFGGYYLLFSLVKIADRAVNGWGTAVKKRFSEAETTPGELVGSQALFTLVWMAIVCATTILASDRLVAYTGLPEAPVLFIVLLFAVTLFEPLDLMVQARGRVGASMWTDTLRSLLTFPLQLGLILLGFGAAGMAYGLAAATFLTVPILWYYVRVRPVSPGRETVASLWSYARFSIPNSLLSQAYDRFDIILLGYLLAPAAAGHYEVALKLTVPATFVTMAAASGLMARVSHRHSKGDDLGTDVSNTLAFTSVVAIPMFFGAVAMPKQLVVTFFGPDYAAAAPLLVGLALYHVAKTQAGVLTSVIDGIDRPDVNTRISAVTLALNIALGVALTLVYGAIGVVVATVVAETLRYVLSAAVVKRRLSSVVLLPRTLAEQVAAGAVMFAVIVPVERAVAVDQWYHLLAIVVLGAVVYAVTLAAISRKLRITIKGVLHSSRLDL
ncbi:oligosaccharide flippase family protein [Natrinema salifodinae]|uniref:Membrane protein involved in the export of O-antigen and teichoic acid n=1 Tax=Natrinema salifodinae TaxID=1202768 RepID=A0A1I0P9T8_9EURY|nr:oligosaccharide flippase family protein [Natrinema salifodinae]SEW11051.1 Membrane protein involved in the export of O-antigen and teichoic acid [Natrinema salifodinae]